MDILNECIGLSLSRYSIYVGDDISSDSGKLHISSQVGGVHKIFFLLKTQSIHRRQNIINILVSKHDGVSQLCTAEAIKDVDCPPYSDAMFTLNGAQWAVISNFSVQAKCHAKSQCNTCKNIRGCAPIKRVRIERLRTYVSGLSHISGDKTYY